MQHQIAILHYTAPPVIGGVESVLGHHVRLLMQAGHNVRVVAANEAATNCFGASFYHFPLVGSQHADVLFVKQQLDQGTVSADFESLVVRILKQMDEAFIGIDLIMAHNVCSLHKNLALTEALRRFCARPDAPRLIIWHHDFAWTSARYKKELHAGYPWNLLSEDWPEVESMHVVVSQLRQQEFSILFKCSAEKAQVVPSGIDLIHFLKLGNRAEELVSDMGLMQSDLILLLPVRITRRKNIELAIEVVNELRNCFSHPMLVVTGPPGAHNQDNHRYLKELIDKRDRLGLNPADSMNGTVLFMADIVDEYLPIETVQDFYKVADGLFLPSFEEGFGIPMLEAGLSGVPVFASDIESLNAIGKNEVSWFDPYGNPADIALQIKEKLRTDSTFIFKRRVRQEFSWKSVYTNHMVPLLEMG